MNLNEFYPTLGFPERRELTSSSFLLWERVILQLIFVYFSKLVREK